MHQLGKGFRTPSPPSLPSTPSEDPITTHMLLHIPFMFIKLITLILCFFGFCGP